MDYFRNIRDFKENIKIFILSKKDLIKKITLPLILIAALLIFFSGNDDAVIVSDEAAELEDTVANANGSIDESDNTAEITEASGFIYVDIGGEVNSPGVYEVSEGTRLFQLIEKAGGLTEDADIDVINRAESVYDGQKILIASYEETEAEKKSTDSKNGGVSTSSVNSSNHIISSDTDEVQVNINTADSVTLQTIPGIGPSKAERIIEYRSTHGSFKSIDDIKNISGIGNKTFESIKKYITV